jgi:myo-inositol-1(or 4)-monophosphatase
MIPPDPEELLEVARAAASAAIGVALAHWERLADLAVEEKAGPHDLVSAADRETEQAVLSVLGARRPDDAVVAEESGRRTGTSGVQWAVDPIDGTTNFLYGRVDWAVSVAALDPTGRVLAGVVAEPAVQRVTAAGAGLGTWTNDVERVADLDQTDLGRALVEVNFGVPAQKADAGRMVDALVPAVRDVRRGGSAASALAQVATRRADGAWVPGLQPWDCAAGILLVSEAGGVVGDLAGATPGRVPASGDVLAAAPALWEGLRQLLASALLD